MIDTDMNRCFEEALDAVEKELCLSEERRRLSQEYLVLLCSGRRGKSKSGSCTFAELILFKKL